MAATHKPDLQNHSGRDQEQLNEILSHRASSLISSPTAGSAARPSYEWLLLQWIPHGLLTCSKSETAWERSRRYEDLEKWLLESNHFKWFFSTSLIFTYFLYHLRWLPCQVTVMCDKSTHGAVDLWEHFLSHCVELDCAIFPNLQIEIKYHSTLSKFFL